MRNLEDSYTRTSLSPVSTYKWHTYSVVQSYLTIPPLLFRQQIYGSTIRLISAIRKPASCLLSACCTCQQERLLWLYLRNFIPLQFAGMKEDSIESILINRVLFPIHV